MFRDSKQFEAFLTDLPAMQEGSFALPKKLHGYIAKAVQDRCFEILTSLYKTITSDWHKKINPHAVLDAILNVASINYNEVEFAELITSLEFDIHFHLQPLFQSAVFNANTPLVTYLAERYHATVDQNLLNTIRQHPNYHHEDSKLPFIREFLEEAYFNQQFYKLSRIQYVQ